MEGSWNEPVCASLENKLRGSSLSVITVALPPTPAEIINAAHIGRSSVGEPARISTTGGSKSAGGATVNPQSLRGLDGVRRKIEGCLR